MTLRTRIKAILDALNQPLIEREEVMNLAFLSALAGESIFLLGPPGVAKSLIARRLKYAFKDARSFEYLMNRFSTPEEVFGPVSIKKLKEEDKLERVSDYYLPGANVAFLDEIWKAGPSIQNTLLTILNEKVFRNGEQELSVDLFAIVSASNELPAPNQGLEALWDRFLLRYHVESIQDQDNFERMICITADVFADTVNQKITKQEWREWQTKRDESVEIPPEVIQLIHHVRVKIQEYNTRVEEEADTEEKKALQKAREAPGLLYISDRRWKKIIRLLRTAAFFNGREKVDLMDCFLIPHAIWTIPIKLRT